MELVGVGVCVVHIGAGADGDPHAFAVEREGDVTGPVASAAQLRVAGKDGDNGLRLGGCDEVAGRVREADDAGGVRDVDPVRLRAQRIERDAEGVVEAAGEGAGDDGVAVRRASAQHHDLSRGAVGDEEVAIGRGADEPRLPESLRIELHLEASGSDGPRAVGTGNQRGAVVDRLIGVWFRQVGEGEFAANAGALLRVIGEGGLAGERGSGLSAGLGGGCYGGGE